ncbi:MAG: hypothetical protein RJQ09_08200 [Cyclobacteriaceae bacterium]
MITFFYILLASFGFTTQPSNGSFTDTKAYVQQQNFSSYQLKFNAAKTTITKREGEGGGSDLWDE